MFKTFIEISIAMSIVIIMVLLISKLLSKKYKIKWRYLIWLLIAIRLLIPINYKITKTVINIEQPSDEVVINVPLISEGTFNKFKTEENNIGTNKIESAESIKATDKKKITLGQMFDIIWKLGMIIAIMFYVGNYILFRLKIRNSLEEGNQKVFNDVKKQLQIKSKIKVYNCKLISSPMFIGFIKPIVLMPDIEYTKEELELIFKHELTHFKRLDVWYKLVLVVANIVHWFNPFVYLMRRCAEKDIEYTCDDIVTKNLDLEQRKDYSRVILKTMEKGGR